MTMMMGVIDVAVDIADARQWAMGKIQDLARPIFVARLLCPFSRSQVRFHEKLNAPSSKTTLRLCSFGALSKTQKSAESPEIYWKRTD